MSTVAPMSWAARVAAPCSKEKIEADRMKSEFSHAIRALKAIGGKYVVYMPHDNHIYPSETLDHVGDDSVFCFDAAVLQTVDPRVVIDMSNVLSVVEMKLVSRRKLLSAFRRELNGKKVIWMRNWVVFDVTDTDTEHDQDIHHISIDRLYGADVPFDHIQEYYDAMVRHRGAKDSADAGSGSSSE